MSSEDNQTAWMCHVCDYRSNVGDGQACSECYKITCPNHLTMKTVLDPESGLYHLKPVCIECQFKQQL